MPPSLLLFLGLGLLVPIAALVTEVIPPQVLLSLASPLPNELQCFAPAPAIPLGQQQQQQQVWLVDIQTEVLELGDEPRSALLPISVVVPLGPKRRVFFRDFVFGSIACNRPAQVIIVTRAGSAPFKRNLGASLASQPYLFFWDDDCVLACNTLADMYAELIAHPEAGFAYGNYWAVVTHGPGHRSRRTFLHRVPPFSAEYMRRIPFADTLSLVKTEAFPGFDESLSALQDYDLWLTVVENGHPGTPLLGKTYIHKFYLDHGISSYGGLLCVPSSQDLYLKWKRVRDKHGIAMNPYPGFDGLVAADKYWVPIQQRSAALCEAIARETGATGRVQYPRAPRWAGMHYVDVWLASSVPELSLEKIRFNELIESAVHSIESAANDDANHARSSPARDGGQGDSDNDIGPGHLVVGPWSRIEKFSVEEQRVQVHAWLNCTYIPLSSPSSPSSRPRELSIAIAVEYTFDVQAHDLVLRIQPAVLPMQVVFVASGASDVEAITNFGRANDIARVADEIVIVVIPPNDDGEEAVLERGQGQGQEAEMKRMIDQLETAMADSCVVRIVDARHQSIAQHVTMNRTTYVAFVDPSLRGVDTAIQMTPFHCIPGRRVFSPCARLELIKGEESQYESSQSIFFLAALSVDLTDRMWKAITDRDINKLVSQQPFPTSQALEAVTELLIRHDYVVLRTYEPDLVASTTRR